MDDLDDFIKIDLESFNNEPIRRIKSVEDIRFIKDKCFKKIEPVTKTKSEPVIKIESKPVTKTESEPVKDIIYSKKCKGTKIKNKKKIKLPTCECEGFCIIF